MWSVWSEQVNVYLGTGLVLVQRPAMTLWCFEPPATWPLDDVLRHVNQALDRANSKPWRLSVYLSAALCPPVAFGVPAGVRRYEEMLSIAQASAVQAWGMPIDQTNEIVCCLDGAHRGLAAAMLAGTHQRIVRWATEHKGHLISLKPLWVVASQARACQTSRVHCLSLHEPGALTFISLKPSSLVKARVWLGQREEACALSLGLGEINQELGPSVHTDGLTMSFRSRPYANKWHEGPMDWAHHWRAHS